MLCALCAYAAPQSQDFGSLARAAQAAIDTNPAQAAELYRKALALKPDWPEGWFYLGGAE